MELYCSLPYITFYCVFLIDVIWGTTSNIPGAFDITFITFQNYKKENKNSKFIYLFKEAI